MGFCCCRSGPGTSEVPLAGSADWGSEDGWAAPGAAAQVPAAEHAQHDLWAVLGSLDDPPQDEWGSEAALGAVAAVEAKHAKGAAEVPQNAVVPEVTDEGAAGGWEACHVLMQVCSYT